MGTGTTAGADFFDQYNKELDRLGCGARVTALPSRQVGMFLVVDLDGKAIAELPSSIQPDALTAVMLLVEQSFEEGVNTGRALERAEG